MYEIVNIFVYSIGTSFFHSRCNWYITITRLSLPRLWKCRGSKATFIKQKESLKMLKNLKVRSYKWT